MGATICNLLDITLDHNVYKAFKKENTDIRYINKNSNHLKFIKKKPTSNNRK